MRTRVNAELAARRRRTSTSLQRRWKAWGTQDSGLRDLLSAFRALSLEPDADLAHTHLYHVVRADFLRRLARDDDAAEAYAVSATLAANARERAWLSGRGEEMRRRRSEQRAAKLSP